MATFPTRTRSMRAFCEKDQTPRLHIDNPYQPTITTDANGNKRFPVAVWRPWAATLSAYALHVLALWGIIWFHEVSNGAQLREPFRWIADYYGNIGLFAIGAVYAIFPALLFAAAAWWMYRRFKASEAWQSGMIVYNTVLGASLGVHLRR